MRASPSPGGEGRGEGERFLESHMLINLLGPLRRLWHTSLAQPHRAFLARRALAPLRLCVFALNQNKLMTENQIGKYLPPLNGTEARIGHQFRGAHPQGRDSSRRQWFA